MDDGPIGECGRVGGEGPRGVCGGGCGEGPRGVCGGGCGEGPRGVCGGGCSEGPVTQGGGMGVGESGVGIGPVTESGAVVDGGFNGGNGSQVSGEDRSHGYRWGQLPETIANATMVTDMNLLKQTVKQLQIRVNQLEKSSHRVGDAHDYCFHLPRHHTTKESLSHILGCQVLCFTCIRREPSISLKVKIPKSGLYTALSSCAAGPHFVRLWYPRVPNRNP